MPFRPGRVALTFHSACSAQPAPMPQALPLQQHPSFARALARMGRDMRIIDLAGSAPVQAIARFGLRLASRGPIWLTASPEAQAIRAARLHLINSDGGDAAVLRAAGYRRIAGPQSVAELSLDGTSQQRFKGLRGKWRNALRRAWETPQKRHSERFNPDRHRWLLQADRAQQSAKGFRALPHAFLTAYADANPDAVHVFIASHQGQPIAAMLFLHHGPVATYHLGWSGVQGRAQKSHHALMMQAADHFAQLGVTRLDLGTVDKESAPGLARFKIGTGARIRELGGTWMKVPLL